MRFQDSQGCSCGTQCVVQDPVQEDSLCGNYADHSDVHHQEDNITGKVYMREFQYNIWPILSYSHVLTLKLLGPTAGVSGSLTVTVA